MAVVTDSTFVSSYVQTHIPKWLENGWKRDDGELVKNRRQYRLLLELMENIAVKWVCFYLSACTVLVTIFCRFYRFTLKMTVIVGIIITVYEELGAWQSRH